MDRRLKALAVVGTLVVCVAAAVVLRDAQAASAIPGPTTIALRAPAGGKTTTVDVGHRDGGHGVGDFAVTSAAPLRDAHTNAPAGTLDVIETIISRSASGLRATALLQGGTIDLDGVIDPRVRTNALAVTGGTGSYANARGAATFVVGRSGATLTFDLLP